LRSIVREAEFEESLAALFEITPEGDDDTESAEILLALNPRIGTVANMGANIWQLPMAPVGEKSVALFGRGRWIREGLFRKR
jgi:hypothetical protein